MEFVVSYMDCMKVRKTEEQEKRRKARQVSKDVEKKRERTANDEREYLDCQLSVRALPMPPRKPSDICSR
jgi:hypothetical protein